MTKIWYDVSGLYEWKGSFTGIQRVVYNLALQLHESSQEVGYFVYRAGVFLPVSYQDLIDNIHRGQSQVSHQKAAATSHKVTFAEFKHQNIVMLKRLLGQSGVGEPLRYGYRKLRSAYRATRRTAVSHGRVQADLFAADDTVIVVDGNWQFAGYIQLMAKMKKKTPFKFVHFVHDMVAVKNPAFANGNADKIIGGYFKEAFPVADMLVAVSESTKRDTEEFIRDNNIATDAVIEVVISGEDFHKTKQVAATEVTAQFKTVDFILAVSTIEVRKNYLSLYYAYKLALDEGITLPHLVIVGKKAWVAEDVYNLLTNDPYIRDSITVIEGVSDAELSWLYQHCLFTIHPAFYEGWGLPIAESLSYGKPSISSNTSSLPEVGGDLVTYISPYDPRQITQAIHELFVDTELRSKLEKRIKKEYRSRTWKQAGRDLLMTLKSLN